jgi:hypothetical protein
MFSVRRPTAFRTTCAAEIWVRCVARPDRVPARRACSWHRQERKTPGFLVFSTLAGAVTVCGGGVTLSVEIAGPSAGDLARTGTNPGERLRIVLAGAFGQTRVRKS